MKRRSKAGGEPNKAQRRKAPEPKRHASKAIPRANSAPTKDETEVARLTHELHEAQEQRAATLEVLRVISSSPGDLTPVFDAMLERATRLCEATHGHVWRFDGEYLHVVAVRGDPQFVEWLR